MTYTAALAPPEWTEQAVCASTDPELFYPEKGGATAEAKRVCNGHPGDDTTRYRAPCPVRAECLAYALDNREMFGIWGGTSERERRTLRAVRVLVEHTEDAA